jgi:hypothetical protein
MPDQPADLWAERRGETAVLVGQLTPDQALEVLQRVVSECTEGRQVAPALMGMIRGIIERNGNTQSEPGASEQGYDAMKEHSPDLEGGNADV